MPLSPSSIIIGRSPSCTLVLDDSYASSRHARVFPKDGAWNVLSFGPAVVVDAAVPDGIDALAFHIRFDGAEGFSSAFARILAAAERLPENDHARIAIRAIEQPALGPGA